VQAGCTDYSFNNVLYNIATTNSYAIGGGLTNPGGHMVMFNNSIEAGYWTATVPLAACVRQENNGQTLSIENVQCMTTYSSVYTADSGASTPTVLTNQLYTLATANSDGYTTAQPFVFSPTVATQPTVKAGTNEQSYCQALAAVDNDAAAACQNDTSYAVGYDAVNHVVVFNPRKTNARPMTGSWDVGAYQF
jgi:hypothetical protein